MRVSELMSRGTVSVSADDTVACAARLMERHNVGVLPVCGAENQLRGVITDRDIAVRCVAGDVSAERTCVREIMTRHVATVSPSADVREAAQLMAQTQVRRLPVVENGKVMGMVSIGDMARTQTYDMEASRALAEISMPEKRRF
ncbi:CBS domain-containing protein [Acidaminobacterium chupaoyuni]